MEEVLRSLSGFIEQVEELRSKVMGALIYPAVLAGLGTVVMLAALMFFVPKFEPLLANAKKPLPSEIMFAASHIVRNHWYLVALAVAGLVALVWFNLRNETVKRKLEVWQLDSGGRFRTATAGDHPVLPHSRHHARQWRAAARRAEDQQGRHRLEHSGRPHLRGRGSGPRRQAAV